MATQRYTVTPHPVETLLTWVKSGEIAIPEIQRPFVWDATKVRNLLDSLYRGYPVGYLIAWRNPTVKLKDGSSSAGNHLKGQGLNRGRYNQIANYVLAQSEINIAIGDKPPDVYFKELLDQCSGGKKKHGGITDLAELTSNLAMSCIPETVLDGHAADYDGFLDCRRKLMASRIKTYFQTL